MAIEYVNRRGDRYYLHQGKTKTGKPKYYVSRKPDGERVETMPEGYELFEHPEQGLVHVRRIRPTNVLPQEREQLAAWTRELAGIEHFIVEVQDDSLVVHTPECQPTERANLLSKLFGGFGEDEASTAAWIGNNITYLPMLRFTLVDQDKRHYAVERWCFRASIADWHHLASGQPLEKQARMYLPHLHQQSFYDLV